MLSKNIRPLYFTLLLFLIAFLGITVFTAWCHEPWRDEADVWLLARDVSLWQFFKIAPHLGQPFLWHGLNMPFAKMGCPYWTLQALNLSMMFGAAFLVLFRSPLPIVLRVTVVFSFIFCFEYSVVARNYGTATFLALLTASQFPHRSKRPLLYGFLLAALANTSPHFLIVASVLAAEWCITQRSKAIVLSIVGIAFSIWQVYPRPGGQFAATIADHFKVELFRKAVIESLNYGALGHPRLEWLAQTSYLAILIMLCRRPKFAVLALMLAAGPLFVILCKYYSGPRHSGILFITTLIALWFYFSESSLQNRLLGNKYEAIAVLIFSTCLAFSTCKALEFVNLERTRQFSESKIMATFIREHQLESRLIAAFPAPVCESVLPYLPKTRFWYPGIKDWGTYMLWDGRYQAGTNTRIEEILRRVRLELPTALLLLNRALPESEKNQYRLVFRTPGKPWGAKDELFFLYEPVKENDLLGAISKSEEKILSRLIDASRSKSPK